MARPSRHSYVLVLLLVLLPLTACGKDAESDATSAGDVVSAQGGVDVAGAPAGFFMLPTGRLDIRAGEPVTSLEADATTEREARSAPEGGSFVPITWHYDTQAMEKLEPVFGQPSSAEMTLVSDRESYKLAPPVAGEDGPEIDAYYVAVDGEGKELTIELEYAGVTQVLDLNTGKVKAGRAEGLYDFDPSKYSEKVKACPSEDWVDEGPAVQIGFTCSRTDAIVTPFVDGEWAPKNSTFVFIGLTSTLTTFAVYGAPGSGATYVPTNSKERSEIAGQGPTRVIDEKKDTGTAAGFLVFTLEGRVPETMTFRRTYTLVRSGVQGSIDAPYERELEVSGEIPL